MQKLFCFLLLGVSIIIHSNRSLGCTEWTDSEINLFKQIEKGEITRGINSEQNLAGISYFCGFMSENSEQNPSENCKQTGGLYYLIHSEESQSFQNSLKANPNRCDTKWSVNLCCYMEKPFKSKDRILAIKSAFGKCASQTKPISTYSVKFKTGGEFYMHDSVFSTSTDVDFEKFLIESASDLDKQKTTATYKILLKDFAHQSFLFQLKSPSRTLAQMQIACAAQCISSHLTEYQSRYKTGKASMCSHRAVNLGFGECKEFAAIGTELMQKAGLDAQMIAFRTSFPYNGHALVGIIFSDGSSYGIDTVSNDCIFTPWLK